MAAAKGAGVCGGCTYSGPPTSHGLCPKCGKRMARKDVVPSGRRDWFAVHMAGREVDTGELERLSLFLAIAFPVSIVGIFALLIASSGELGGQAVQLPPGLMAALVCLALVYLTWDRIGETLSLGDGGRIRTCYFRRIQLHGRNALFFQVGVDPADLERGNRIELSVRLRAPGGDFLKSRSDHYRDPQGCFQASQVSEPYNTAEHSQLPAQLVFPLHALDLVAADEGFPAVAEVTAFDGEEVIGTRQLELEIPRTTADFPALDVDHEGIEVTASDSVAAAHCMVCGDVLAGPTVCCRACEVAHHHDCWEYNGGCSTYGCEGRPIEPVGAVPGK